jgi:dUTP pyrophosphatase
MILKFKKLYLDSILPEKKSDEAAGLDLYSYKEILLKKEEVVLVQTGFSMEIPKGYFADIRPRSGFSTKNKIIIPNSPGTIDSDYRGEILVPFLNLSGKDFLVDAKTRIAQLVILKLPEFEIEIVEELTETRRGERGFGSTGLG